MEPMIAFALAAVSAVAACAVTWLAGIKRQGNVSRELQNLKADKKVFETRIIDLGQKAESLNSDLSEKSKLLFDSDQTLNSLKQDLARVKQGNDDLQKNLNKANADLEKNEAKNEHLQERKSHYKMELATHLRGQEEREKSLKDQLAHLEVQKKELKKEFENIANRIFEEKGKTFNERSQSSLNTTLKPLKEKIDSFQKRMNEINDQSIKGNTTLQSEIKKVLDVGLKMQDEATNLTSALKGDSQQRGAWGEAQLERTLQMSGLIQDAHYTTQDSFTDLDGQRRRTDYIIRLPDNKCLIIDSKMTLPDYDRAVSAQTPEEINVAMKAHVSAVKKHIDDLQKKDYANVTDIESPDFILMFMPVEPAFIEALKFDKELFNYGYSKNVVLVSHTTLIPILRTISNLWILEQSNREAQKLGDTAVDIWNSVCSVVKQVKEMGKTLASLTNKHNDLVTKLVGNQGLSRKVERFDKMSTKTKKEMAADLEPVQFSSDDPRLNLTAKPLSEAPKLEEYPTQSDPNGSADQAENDVSESP
jgi:DNA recombination protein RmuC